ncbi:MAG: hypothetical protein AB1424_09265 [Thermodesulfobacteriota bacterium]
MDDPFESSKLRLARANEHILIFEKRRKSFLKAKEWTDIVERDPDGINDLHKIKFTKPFPDEFTLIATEALEHLRASLDQAAYAVAVASGTANPKSAYFPFAQDAAGLQTVIKGRCKNIPSDIVTLFCSFQPYKGGNDLLYALNSVCIANKHRELAKIGIIPGLTINNIQANSIYGPIRATVPQLTWDRRKNEIIYLIVPSNPKPLVHCNIVITLNIAFDEIIGGKPALAVLRDMASEVQNILEAVEGGARTLGIV